MSKPIVLLVDDEPNLVAGLRRVLLRGRRWTVMGATSGDEALGILDREPVVVLLSDMQMPGMDGSQLLRRVRADHPRVARIVLSGDSDRDASLRALRVAHRFLSKPTDADDLIDAVSRACALRGRFEDLRMAEELGAVEALPSPPDLLRAVTEMMEDPHADLRQIGELVEGDPALSAKLLQTVNSAFFGLPQRQSSAAAAVAYLGTSTVQAIVAMAALGEVRNRLTAATMDAFDIRAQTVSRIARGLVPAAHRADAQAVGLLHDIGWVIISTVRPDLTAGVAGAITAACDHAPAELPVHGDVGAYLLDLWGLPETMVEAVALHHGPCAADTSDLAHALQVAVALHDHTEHAPLHPCLDEAHLQATGLGDRVAAWRSSEAQESHSG